MNIVTLTNGKKVGNFSSPHPFTFTDGSILPAVSNEEAEKLAVVFNEIPRSYLSGDIELTFDLSKDIVLTMLYWYVLWTKEEVDVVFCPLPMLTALKENYPKFDLGHSPFRSIRINDRINKLVCIDKQCI